MLLLVLLAVAVAYGSTAPKLESYSVDPSSVSVSGLSSGGCFAVQFHVSFSASLCGAGVVAGVPYWCAQLGYLEHALTDCMKVPSLIDVQKLVEATDFAYATGTIDDPSHLSRDRVFLFSGSKDTVVHPGVMRKVQDYYQSFVSASNMVAMFSIPAEHSMVTDGYGNSCGVLGSPYINNCSYSTAYYLLQHIYQNLTLAKADRLDANLLEFDQSEFTFPTAGAVSMDTTGYVYVPTACRNSSTVCRLHIAFHGCKQGREYLSSLFPLHAGYGTVAEANNIIVLYPQVVSSLYNPKGCWDWWGYTGADYAVKTAPQMRAVKNMLDRVLGTYT